MKTTDRLLKEVTLVAVASTKVQETIKALSYSMRGLSYAEVLFVTHEDVIVPEGIRVVKIPQITSIEDYNQFMLMELHRFIATPYALVVQWDGYVVHPELWDSSFLEYDYIGAPWPEEISPKATSGDVCRVGNGGCSLRSKALLELPSKLSLSRESGDNEDTFLVCTLRDTLLKEGLIVAPVEVAVRFSQERTVPEAKGVTAFAFHQWEGHNAGYPQFNAGFMGSIKRKIIHILLAFGLYDGIHTMLHKNS